MIFGLTVSSSWGNGHATLWRGLWRALAREGHTVVFFERDVPYYAEHRDLDHLPGGTLVLYADWADVVDRAKRHLADADVGMVTSYCPDAHAASALLLDAAVPHKAFYDLDTPVTLEALRAGEAVPYIPPRGLGDFDLVLSYTGGRALDELRTRLGARRVAPLYGHVDPDEHRPVAPAPQYVADLSYLGTYAPDRQPALESLLVEPARRLPELRFCIAGALYPSSFPWAANIAFVRHHPPHEHPAFFSSSRLTLNITRRAMAEMGYCPSGRLFEAAACGTPVLSDWWPGLDAFFTPGEQLLVARDTEQAMAALQIDPATLARIGRAARERTLDAHTSTHRARELVAVLSASGARGGVAAGPP